MKNGTSHLEFIIMGFSELPQHQLLLFALFFTIYLLTLLENVLLIVTIWLNIHLRTPMYFFLGNLSILEIFYVSVTMPKLFSNLLLGEKIITLGGCLTQLYFFLSLASSECFLLASMAYDRYLAICCPLHYTSLMNHRAYMTLSLASWLGGFLACFPSVIMMSNLQFCNKNTIRHFFCDISPLLRLSCTDTSLIELLDFVAALAVLMTSLLVTGTSYICIFCTVAKIPSAKGKRKAFSTCVSHLTIVSMFYATTIFMYARPKAIGTFDLNKMVSILYTVVAPFLNPMIYGLRNREVRETLTKAMQRKAIPSR
ncbi:olfactory receptor 6P1-like [Sphaerodactylus townsendi]|uniref:olfactory receptor 6P1-like n=1 Tax=Sphaerodactylus townsendi TaxID=933632 RepID=UPI0020260D9D|nr:olfactory receptor 6P1-like [Sphaerodactylus townsendi]